MLISDWSADVYSSDLPVPNASATGSASSPPSCDLPSRRQLLRPGAKDRHASLARDDASLFRAAFDEHFDPQPFRVSGLPCAPAADRAIRFHPLALGRTRRPRQAFELTAMPLQPCFGLGAIFHGPCGDVVSEP